MFRAEVQPMPENQPDRVYTSGLWKVVIYEGERLVRTDQERITYLKANKIAREMNFRFGLKKKARGV
jgi:hypothetical protein